MIKLLYKLDLDFCKENSLYNPILSKISSIYDMQKHNVNCLLYNQLDEEESVTAVFLIFNGEINVSLKSEASISELKDFFEIVGYNSVFSNLKIFEKSQSGYSMKYSGENVAFSDAKIVSSEEISRCYEILNNIFQINVSFEDWFVDMSYKVRHNKAIISAIQEKNIVSLAIAMYKTEFSSIITGVCTDKNFRNQNFASKCVNKLIEKLKKDNIEEIYVFCEDDLVDFYKNLTFEIDGSWQQYVR